MSSIDLPSIHTSFVPYTSSTSPNSSSRPYRSASPGSPSPPMTFQGRSYSTSSTSSLLSAYSTSTDRSQSVSPGPATPCDGMSRSPSLSQESSYKPTLPSLQLRHFAPLSPSSPLFYPSPSYSHSPRHHPYSSPNKQQELKPFSPSIYQGRTLPPPHFSISSPSLASRPLPSPSSPRDMYSSHPSPRDHIDHHLRQPAEQVQQQQQRSSFGYVNDYFQSRPPMSTASTSPSASYAYQSIHPLMAAPKEEERESLRRSPSSAEDEDDYEEEDAYEYTTSMSDSRSLSPDGSEFSMESSPSPAEDRFDSMSEASTSMTSLASTSSSSSMTPVPTTTQLLLCPVCSRAFKPSKNQNCNLRRHLKNVHNMSPTMHPRKCKWDSLPDGRVKDDKDRKERTRKSKRLWARKYRLRRKVEEAALVLSMLSQAV